MSKLLADIFELLAVSNFLKKVDLPPAAQNLLVEFEDLYKHLGTELTVVYQMWIVSVAQWV